MWVSKIDQWRGSLMKRVESQINDDALEFSQYQIDNMVFTWQNRLFRTGLITAWRLVDEMCKQSVGCRIFRFLFPLFSTLFREFRCWEKRNQYYKYCIARKNSGLSTRYLRTSVQCWKMLNMFHLIKVMKQLEFISNLYVDNLWRLNFE